MREQAAKVHWMLMVRLVTPNQHPMGLPRPLQQDPGIDHKALLRRVDNRHSRPCFHRPIAAGPRYLPGDRLIDDAAPSDELVSLKIGQPPKAALCLQGVFEP